MSDNFSIVACPHCGGGVQIFDREIACTIFRHGTIKATGQQIPPHASQQVCEDLVRTGQIHGCGKPFRYDGKEVSICGYI